MATLFNRRFFIFTAFIAGYICIALTFASFHRNYNFKPVLIPKGEHNKPLGRIIAGTVFIQEIQMHNDFLCAIEIELATWNRTNKNRNKLVILDNGFTILQEIEFQSDSIKDNSFRSFFFKKPIEIGKDKHFFVCLLSEDGQDNNCITAWTDTVATTGKLYQESISKLGLQETVKTRKNLLKGSLQIKTIESEKTGFIMAFLFMFCLLGISTVLIYKLKGDQTVRSIELILLIFFVISLLTPSLYFIFMQTEKKEKSNWEKRMLATKPVFDIRNLGEYLPQMQSFINDHIPFRDEIISYKAGFYYKYFKKSSFPNISVIGKEGWIFRTGEKDAIEGNRDISKDEILEIVKILHTRTEYYKKIGIHFYVALIPMKTELYKEFLPSYYSQSVKDNYVNEIRSEIKKDTLVRFIDLLPSLMDAKAEGQIYYKNDMHWTPFGAFSAYKDIINHIKKDFPHVQPIEGNQIEFQYAGKISWGDAIELCIQDYVSEPYYFIKLKKIPNAKNCNKKGYLPQPKFHLPNEYEIHRCSSNAAMPNIVIIRDSFYQTLVELTSENFNNSLFIWDNWEYGINEEIIKKEKPDIVLLEAYIGFLPNILKANK
jgi:hypothetical protein